MIIKNFSFSIIYKLLGMSVSFTLVPLLIGILGVEKYGLWVTLTSLLVWLSLFDFGLGFALKNTVSKSIAKNNILEAQLETKQILKVTVLMSYILLVLFIIMLFIFDLFKNNTYLVLTLFIPFIMSFPLRTGSPILQGARKIAFESGLLFINILLFFLSIVILNFIDMKIDLISLSILFVSSYLISTLLTWIYAMKVIQMNFIDLTKIFQCSIDIQRIKIGLKFFGLQISSLVLYSIGTVIVFTYLSATEAAHYDVLNKIFLFGLSIFNIGIGVFWPEIVHHLESKNFLKIRRLYFIMIGGSSLFSLSSVLFSFFVPEIIKIWTHNKIIIEQKEAIYFSFLVSLQAIVYSGAVVLNAFEKINFQLVLSIISTVLMLPLSIYFIKIGYEITAIPLAAGILTAIPAIYCNIHALKLINNGE